jgi:oxygen-independent coproporphyrinogen III oxidase
MMDPDLLARYDRAVPRYTSYPTAPHFHAGIDAATYGRWLGALPAGMPLSLYLHIPFCQSLCWYCGCHTTVARHYGRISDYLEVLLAEIALVAGALGERRPVSHVHLGGGTPTMLDAHDLERLGRALGEHFDLLPEAEIAVEIDPRTLTLAGVGALAAIGVNRASLGVQDVNPKVQRAINRWQPLEMTERAVGWLRAAGIGRINVDLIYGLPHQTEGLVVRSVEGVLALAPDRVALFGYAHVPWMKRHQRLIDESALPGREARAGQFRAAAARLLEAGYVAIGIDHFARRSDSLVIAQREGRLQRNFQGYTTDDAATLLGFGASSIGSLPQGYVQNAVSIGAWRTAIRDGMLAVVRGLALDSEDRVRRAIIERLMCDFAVDLDQLCSRLGWPADLLQPELDALAPLVDDGLVERDGRVIRVTARGRPLVRVVCAAFDAYLGAGAGRHSRAI